VGHFNGRFSHCKKENARALNQADSPCQGTICHGQRASETSRELTKSLYALRPLSQDSHATFACLLEGPSSFIAICRTPLIKADRKPPASLVAYDYALRAVVP
jgi:hypothetical protein